MQALINWQMPLPNVQPPINAAATPPVPNVHTEPDRNDRQYAPFVVTPHGDTHSYHGGDRDGGHGHRGDRGRGSGGTFQIRAFGVVVTFKLLLSSSCCYL
jgi:hypothetical protein